jgi:hypothetical protein
MIHYGERLFRPVSTVGKGDVGANTIFRYEQRDTVLMGTYSGGTIEFGSLIGKVHRDGRLTFLYQHITKSGTLKSGKCESRPEILPSGKIRLHESWEWLSGQDIGQTGTSVVEEF